VVQHRATSEALLTLMRLLRVCFTVAALGGLGCGGATPDSHLGRAIALDRNGRQEEALEEYRLASEGKVSAPGYRSAYGVALARAGRHEAAMKELQVALEMYADNADAQCWLAYSLQSVGKSAEALTASDAAVKLDPLRPMNVLTRGMILRSLGRDPEACAELEKADRLEPGILNRNPRALAVWQSCLLAGH
jgi:tetratricopeptide (TPR) repeat protein